MGIRNLAQLEDVLSTIDALYKNCRLDIRHRELFTRAVEANWVFIRSTVSSISVEARRYLVTRSLPEIEPRYVRAWHERYLARVPIMQNELDADIDRIVSSADAETLPLPFSNNSGRVIIPSAREQERFGSGITVFLPYLAGLSLIA